MTQTQPQESLGSLVEDFDRHRGPEKPQAGHGGGTGGLPPRNIILSVVAFGCLIAAGVFAARALRSETSSLERWTQEHTLIDMVTGEVFEDMRLADGVAFPVRNPNTGTDTLVPAEECFWTRDGRAKLEPTWVYVPQSGEATCPDCGRKVVGRNPSPPVALMVEAVEREKAAGGR